MIRGNLGYYSVSSMYLLEQALCVARVEETAIIVVVYVLYLVVRRSTLFICMFHVPLFTHK